MKVLHIITDTNIGGAGRYLLNLLTQPAFKDLDIVVACPDGELGKRLDAANIRRVNVSGKDVSFSPKLTRELRGLMKLERPDLVHTHSSLSGRIAARSLRIPIVYTKHNLVRIPDEKGIVPPRAGFFKRFFNKTVANKLSNRVIAVSDGVWKELLESGMPSSLVVSIPNGIDLSPYNPRLRFTDEAGKRGPVIGTVARLHRQKALEVFLESAKMVLSSDPSARFLIAGTGPLEGELKAKIRELRLDPYVKMVGFVSDVPGFLDGLDIYVLSSDYEGLPLAVLEAMAAGLPIVSTAVGGMPEAVADGQTGFLVPPRQPKSLAQAVVRMLVDRDMARSMGAASRTRAEELFDAKVMAEKTVKVYRQVAEERGLDV